MQGQTWWRVGGGDRPVAVALLGLAALVAMLLDRLDPREVAPEATAEALFGLALIGAAHTAWTLRRRDGLLSRLPVGERWILEAGALALGFLAPLVVGLGLLAARGESIDAAAPAAAGLHGLALALLLLRCRMRPVATGLAVGLVPALAAMTGHPGLRVVADVFPHDDPGSTVSHLLAGLALSLASLLLATVRRIDS